MDFKEKESERHYFYSEEVESVRVVWNEYGYKLIQVNLKTGGSYTVESD